MDLAIIIGFSYNKNNEDLHRHHLPGILIDIYRVYKYTKQLTDNIIIITDLRSESDTKIVELKDSIINNNVDIEILNFLGIIKNSGLLHEYTTKKDLLTTIKREVHLKSKIFIYYTGHSLHGNILLPTMNNEICYLSDNPTDFTLNFSILRDALSTSVPEAQIMVILDCCGSQGLHLPYKLQNQIYNLTSRSDKKYPLQEIICFSSTMSDEVSIASKNGSLFSHTFFKYLFTSRKVSDLLEVLTVEISKKFNQTPTVYVTYPNLKMLWRWLYRTDNVNVKFNLMGNYFVVRKIEDPLKNDNKDD